MKLKVNPPIALESTELYNGIRFHKGVTTTDGTNQTITIKPRFPSGFIFIVSFQSTVEAKSGLLLIGGPWRMVKIYEGYTNNMPSVTIGGNGDTGCTFTFAETNTYYYWIMELGNKGS